MSLLDKLKERERYAADMRRQAVDAVRAYEDRANRNKLAVAGGISQTLSVWKGQLDIRVSTEVSEYQWRRRAGFSGSDAVFQIKQPNTSWYIYYQIIGAERWIRVNAAIQAPNQNARTRRLNPEHLILRPDDAGRDPELPSYVRKTMKMFFWTVSKARG